MSFSSQTQLHNYYDLVGTNGDERGFELCIEDLKSFAKNMVAFQKSQFKVSIESFIYCFILGARSGRYTMKMPVFFFKMQKSVE